MAWTARSRRIEVVTDVETIIHEGVPIFWFNPDFDTFSFERRWLKIERSFNFMYIPRVTACFVHF